MRGLLRTFLLKKIATLLQRVRDCGPVPPGQGTDRALLALAAQKLAALLGNATAAEQPKEPAP